MKMLMHTAALSDEGRKIKYFVRSDMHVSYHQFSSLKMHNGLLVNGIAVHANHILHAGDEVTVLLEDNARETAVPEEGSVNIVYEDEDIIILNKPAPLACQCSPKQPANTLENRLAWHYKNIEGFVFRPLNRLDKGTSGLMAAAKHAHACQVLQKQLHTPEFMREYLAVVEGTLSGEGVVDAPIAKVDEASVKRIVNFETGKRAVTHYRAVYTGEGYSLVRLRLETGRTHQIRVHMVHLGHPIVGDFLYGKEDARLPGRFALHSARIRLIHPISGEIIDIEAPLPDELQSILNSEQDDKHD